MVVVAGQYLVKAKSFKDAVAAVEGDLNDLFPLENANGEYVDDSFEVNKECCCTVQPHEVNSFGQPVVSITEEDPPEENIYPVLGVVVEESNEESSDITYGSVSEEFDEGFDVSQIPTLNPPTD